MQQVKKKGMSKKRITVNFTEQDIQDLQEAFDNRPWDNWNFQVFRWSIDDIDVQITVGDEDEATGEEKED